MNALSWSVSGPVAPTSTYQLGDRVWLQLAGDLVPAVITRLGRTKVQVAFHRPRRGIRPLLRRAIRRQVGGDVLCMRLSLAGINHLVPAATCEASR